MSVKPTNEDGNFIAKTENKEAENKTEEEIKKVLEGVIITEKKGGVFPKKKQERSLGHETGGVEKDYDKIEEKTNEDSDLWDVKAEVKDNPAQFESSANQSFIHSSKLRGKGRKRKLGAMILNKDKAENALSSHVEALKKQRSDPSQGGGRS